MSRRPFRTAYRFCDRRQVPAGIRRVLVVVRFAGALFAVCFAGRFSLAASFLPIFFRSGRFLPNLCTFCAVFFIPCYDSGEVEERQKEGTEKKKKFLLQSALRPMGGREREGFPHGGAAGKGRRIVKFF